MAKRAADETKNAAANEQGDMANLVGELENLLGGGSGSSSGGEEETPPIVQTYTLADVDSSKINSMKECPSVVEGKVNSILTSYDSDLTPIGNSVVRKKYATFYNRLETM